MQRLTLKPSVLVAFSIGRLGGVRYARQPLDQQRQGEREVTSWQTTREVDDVEELRRAQALVAECRRRMGALCYRTAFGWVAPREREAELAQTWAEIRARVEQANAEELRRCRLVAACVTGEIAQDDQAAADAILADIARFFGDVMEALQACDVRRIRQTVAGMRGVEALLPDAQSEALRTAVRQARRLATVIRQEVERKGREIEAVVRELDLSPIDAARVMFIEPEVAEAAAAAPAGASEAVGAEAAPELWASEEELAAFVAETSAARRREVDG